MKNIFKIICGFVLIFIAFFIIYHYSGFSISERLDDLIYKDVVTTTTAQNVKSDSKNLDNIMYTRLNDEEKEMYNTIYNGLIGYRPSVHISGNYKSEKVFYILNTVLAEHPEIFWNSGGCSYVSNGTLEFDYAYSREEVEAKNTEIQNKVDEILANIDLTADDYTKSLEIFEYIVENTTYDQVALDTDSRKLFDSTIEGVFLKGTAVCSGYAKAYQYLLRQIGIDSLYITGVATTSDGAENHAWICQRIDGDYYFTDPTWADSYETTSKYEFISHIYFCITKDEISATHTCDEKYDFLKADSVKDNYFIRENLIFDKYKESNIRTSIKNNLNSTNNGIEFKFSNAEEYNQAKKKLVEYGEIYLILKSIDLFSAKIDSENIYYALDDTHKVVTIIFEKNKQAE